MPMNGETWNSFAKRPAMTPARARPVGREDVGVALAPGRVRDLRHDRLDALAAASKQ